MKGESMEEPESYREKFERLRGDFERFKREHYDRLLKLYTQLRRTSISLSKEYASLSDKHETLIDLLVDRAKEIVEALEEAKEKEKLEDIARYGLMEEEFNILFRVDRLLQHDYLIENDPQKMEEFEQQLKYLKEDDSRAAEVVRRYLEVKKQEKTSPKVEEDTQKYLMDPKIRAYLKGLNRPPTKDDINKLTKEVMQGKIGERSTDDELEEEADKARAYEDQMGLFGKDIVPSDEELKKDLDTITDEEVANAAGETGNAVEGASYEEEAPRESKMKRPRNPNEWLLHTNLYKEVPRESKVKRHRKPLTEEELVAFESFIADLQIPGLLEKEVAKLLKENDKQ